MRALIFITLLFGFSAEAGLLKKSKKDVNTEFNFNGMNVKGRYNMPSESLIRVEDDKSINNLIFIRSNFRDRIKESSSRN